MEKSGKGIFFLQSTFLLLLAVVIFFSISFLLLSVKIFSSEKVRVPMLIGTLYFDQHNDLNELGLKIRMEYENRLEYPEGYIFSQSFEVNSLVKVNSQMTLLVNKYNKIVSVPNFVNKHVLFIPDILQNIYVGSKNYPLKEGKITYIPHEGASDIILSQLPKAGTKVTPNTKISFLVSSSSISSKKKNNKYFDLEPLKKLSYLFIYDISKIYKIPLLLKYISTQRLEDHLTVHLISWGGLYKSSRVLEVEFYILKNTVYDFDTEFYGGDRVHTLYQNDFATDIYTFICKYEQYSEEYSNIDITNSICTKFYVYINKDVEVYIPKMYHTSLSIWRGVVERSTFTIEPLKRFYVKDIQL